MPVSVLPGGSTNVVCRTLGIPNDVVDATEHLLALADDWAPRKIDLGMVDDRHFVFACGVGIDATVVERVDAHPRLKSSAGPYYYSWAGDLGLLPQVPATTPVRVRVETGGEPVEGVTAIVQNSDPFTYFASRPIRVCEGIAIDDGTLSIGGPEARRPARHADPDQPPLQREQARRRATARSSTSTTSPRRRSTSISEDKDGALRPFPLQVDGDYIGDRTRVELRADPGALTIVA